MDIMNSVEFWKNSLHEHLWNRKFGNITNDVKNLARLLNRKDLYDEYFTLDWTPDFLDDMEEEEILKIRTRVDVILDLQRLAKQHTALS